MNLPEKMRGLVDAEADEEDLNGQIVTGKDDDAIAPPTVEVGTRPLREQCALVSHWITISLSL